jgi:hypothetical protein
VRSNRDARLTAVGEVLHLRHNAALRPGREVAADRRSGDVQRCGWGGADADAGSSDFGVSRDVRHAAPLEWDFGMSRAGHVIEPKKWTNVGVGADVASGGRGCPFRSGFRRNPPYSGRTPPKPLMTARPSNSAPCNSYGARYRSDDTLVFPIPCSLATFVDRASLHPPVHGVCPP